MGVVAITEKVTGVRSAFVTVTPEQAVKWLEGNTHNRPVRDSVVMKYAADMKSGRWRQTHQGIAFDEEGVLIDGQHRLYAVMEAGVSVILQVTYGLPIDTQIVIDDHLKRTVIDVMKLSDEEREGISNMHISVVNRMVRGVAPRTSGSAPTRQEIRALLDKHWDAISFAVGLFPKTRVVGISRANVIAAIARASYTQDHEKLKRFADVLISGLSGPSEAVIITLRNWLLTTRRPGGAVDEEVYGKTTRALMAYIKGDRIRTLYATRDDLFPLPIERRAKEKTR